MWMLIYLISLPIWNFVLPTYAYWKFDDFSWGDTRKTSGEKVKKAGIEYEGEFDSSKITMKRWGDFEQGKCDPVARRNTREKLTHMAKNRKKTQSAGHGLVAASHVGGRMAWATAISRSVLRQLIFCI